MRKLKGVVSEDFPKVRGIFSKLLRYFLSSELPRVLVKTEIFVISY